MRSGDHFRPGIICGAEQDCDSVIRVSNYVLPNPGLQVDRPLWSGASNKLCTFSRGKEIYATLAKMAEVVRNRLRAWINEILQQLASPNLDSDSQESVFYRIETLYNTVVRFDGVGGINVNIVNHLRAVRDLLSSHCLSFSAHTAERLFTGQRGRPKYILPQEQLEFLVERRFSVPQISKLLGVSPRTVERRLSEHELSIRQTTPT